MAERGDLRWQGAGAGRARVGLLASTVHGKHSPLKERAGVKPGLT